MKMGKGIAYLLKERRLFTVALAILVTQAIATVLLPLPLKFLTDHLFTVPQEIYRYHLWNYPLTFTLNEILGFALGFLFILGAISAVLEYAEEIVLVRLSTQLIERERKRLIYRLFDRNLDFFNQQRKVELVNKICSDTENLSFYAGAILPAAVRALPTLLFILISMLLVDYRFAFLLAILLPGIWYIAAKFSIATRLAMKQFTKECALLDTDIHEAMSAMSLIKSLVVERKVQSNLFQRIRTVSEKNIEAQRLQGKLVATLAGSKHLIRFFVVFLGAIAILNSMLTLGELVLFVSYIELLAKPINELAKLSTKWSRAQVSMERIEELEKSMRGHLERGGSQNCKTMISQQENFVLSFDNASFYYQEEKMILEGFSAKFYAGEFITICGESGVGKTSFAKLFNRLLGLKDGAIYWNNIRLQDFSLPSLREKVFYLSQENYSVYASIRENLSLAKHGKNDDDFWLALQKANAEDFVRNLPQGLDTIIGDGAQVLSGGQVRRLNIARAFLRSKTRIFVFDEATSGLDPESSQIVFRSVQELCRSGALVFWITHRDEEMHNGKILHFENGKNPIIISPQRLTELWREQVV